MGTAIRCSDSDEPIWRDRTSGIPAEKEDSEWHARPMADGAIGDSQTCAELVHLLVSAHHDVQGFSAEHDSVAECIELGRGGDQSWILALYPNLLLDADLTVLIRKGTVGLVVYRCSCCAEG